VTITTCEDCKREIPDGEKRRCIIEDGVSTSWCKECLKKQGPIEDVLKEHYEKEVLVDFRANLQSGDRVHVIVKDQDCGVMVLKEPSAKGCWYMRGSSNSYNECWLFPIPEPEKLDMIHKWFELSYAQYLTVPRSIMEAMPDAWQTKMAELLNELDVTYNWRPEGQYRCTLHEPDYGYGEACDRGEEDFDDERFWGLPEHDPLAEYRHPDKKYIESIKEVPE